MIKPFRKALGAALVAGAALGSAATADAKLVVGVFDPAFGAALSGVDFSGTATFTIDQNCLNNALADATGVFIYATSICNGHLAGMSFLGAHVDFTGSQTGYADFADNPFGILGMFVQNHQVVGVQSIILGPVTSTLPGHEQFKLVFGQTNPVFDFGDIFRPPERNDGDNDYDDMPGSAFQSTHLILVGGDACRLSACPSQSNAAATHFVPEPGSLTLVLGALGVGWIARRRKQGAAVAIGA